MHAKADPCHEQLLLLLSADDSHQCKPAQTSAQAPGAAQAAGSMHRDCKRKWTLCTTLHSSDYDGMIMAVSARTWFCTQLRWTQCAQACWPEPAACSPMQPATAFTRETQASAKNAPAQALILR